MEKGNNDNLFETSRKGYNKEAVDEYLLIMNDKFNVAVNGLNKNIADLKAELEACKSKCKQLETECNDLKDERSKIADVLINAETSARKTQDEADKKARETVIDAENKAESLLEMIVDRRKTLRNMKNTSIDSVDGLRGELSKIFERFIEELDKSKDTFAENMSTAENYAEADGNTESSGADGITSDESTEEIADAEESNGEDNSVETNVSSCEEGPDSDAPSEAGSETTDAEPVRTRVI